MSDLSSDLGDESTGTSFYATVDRFEGKFAILIAEKRVEKRAEKGARGIEGGPPGKPDHGPEPVTLEFPLELLPGNLKEGQVLLVSVKIDDERTERTRRHVADLLKRLGG